MKLLKAPEGCTAATTPFGPVEIVDGICEVEDHVARELEPHGFKEFAPGTNDDPRPPADGEEMTQKELYLAAVAKMDRRELFSLAKGYGVALTAKMTTEAMRTAMVDHVERMDAQHTKPPAAVIEQVQEKIEKIENVGTKAAEDVKSQKPADDGAKGNDGEKQKPEGGDGADEFGPKVEGAGDGKTE